MKIWDLETQCTQCCDHLRHDALWSSTLSEIPETPDEVSAREDFDKRGARDKDQVLALALAKLAGVELPESMLRPITGNLPQAIALMECPNGHASKPGAKFCADCGTSMQQPANAITAAPLLCPEGHQNAAGSQFCSACGYGFGTGAPETPQAQDSAHHTPPGNPGPAAKKPRMRDMKREDLARIASERGLDDSGTRMELLDRIRAAA